MWYYIYIFNLWNKNKIKKNIKYNDITDYYRKNLSSYIFVIFKHLIIDLNFLFFLFFILYFFYKFLLHTFEYSMYLLQYNKYLIFILIIFLSLFCFLYLIYNYFFKYILALNIFFLKIKINNCILKKRGIQISFK